MNPIRLSLRSGGSEKFYVKVEGGGEEISILPFFDEQSLKLYTIINILDGNSLDSLNSQQHRLMIDENILDEGDELSKLEHQSIVRKIGEKLFHALFLNQTRNTLEQELNRDFLHIQICYKYQELKDSKIPLYPWHLAFFQSKYKGKEVYCSYLIEDTQPSRKEVGVKREKVKLVLIASDASDNLSNASKISPQKFRKSIVESINKLCLKNKTVEVLDVYENETKKEKPCINNLNHYIANNLNADNSGYSLVVNFYGHGIFKKICTTSNCSHPKCDVSDKYCSECNKELGEPQGYLLFQENDGNFVEYVSSEMFTNIVSSFNPKPVLAVITACYSARAYDSKNVYTGIAQSLIANGISTVVAFPFRLSDDGASKFSRSFYQFLFQPNSSIFQAFRAGIIACEENEWYRPVLFLRKEVNDGKLFSLQNSPRFKPLNSSRGNPEKKTNLHEKEQVFLRNLELVLEEVNEAYKNSCVFSHEILMIYEMFIESNIFTAQEYTEGNHQKLLELYKQRIKTSQQKLNGIFNFDRPPSWFQNIHQTPSKKQRKNKCIATTKEMIDFFKVELKLSIHKSSWSTHFDDTLGQNYVMIMGYCRQLENFWWNLRQEYMRKELGIKK